MLICKLSDQLGNQMFAYAAIKSIAKDKGYKFGVLNEYDNQFLKNDVDKKFGCNLLSIFENIRNEIVSEVPEGYKEYVEKRKGNSSLQEEVIQIADNTLMKGHYISPLYFMHRLSEVQEWFQFPKEIENESIKTLEGLKAQYPEGTKFCSVHFRNALDYRVKGYMLSKKYWITAARKLLANTSENIVFILFYDKKSQLITDFKKKMPSIIIHKSLLEDFCLISKCDYHIVCNSSFSVMAALMDRKSVDNTYCPSIWPIPKGLYPIDTYPDKWIKVKTTRNIYSYLFGFIAPYLSPFKYLIKYLK